MSTIKFEVVKLKGYRTINIDGKIKKQQKTFFQTINPFNKNMKGLRIGCIKNRDDILNELREDIKNWQNECLND